MALKNIPETVRHAILEFVDSVVPDGGESVWLTGSRVRGDARPDSDWDVLVITRYFPRDADLLFDRGTQISKNRVEGGQIELVMAHPDHQSDPRQYMAELRESGVRLR